MSKEETRIGIFLLFLVFAIALAGGGFVLYARRVDLSIWRDTWRAPGPAHALASPKRAKSSGTMSFALAMDELTHAFERHPGYSKREVIDRVNAGTLPGNPQPCPLQWRNDEAELTVGENIDGKLSLANSVASCSEAIDRLPN